MSLPNVTDYARLHPPYASVVEGREPVVQWHSTRGGAKRSAQANSWTLRDLPKEEGERSPYKRHEWVVQNDHAVAVLEPGGALRIVEEWKKGETRRW